MMQIKTKYGIVEGTYDGDREHLLFAGIPYAKPPVGDLRWRPPQKPEPWEGVRRCQSFPPAAVQNIIPVEEGKRWMCYGQEYFLTAGERFDEDCLYLNIWVRRDRLESGEHLPVLVIIHGGGYTTGAGHVPVLRGRNFSDQDVVVVTINYRLGIFGFLAHPALSAEQEGHSGNYGLMDQIEALRWVRENIDSFGGNPDCVTIAGESAGGGSVSVLYQSPLASGLFHRAFAQSPAVFNGTSLDGGEEGNLSNREEANRQAFLRLGVQTAEEMRALDVKTLKSIQGTWCPVYDGYVLPGTYRSIFESGSQNDVPLLLGSNSDEGLIFASPKMERAQFEKELERQYGAFAPQVKGLYLDHGEMPQAVFEERRDRMFEQHTYVWALMQAKYGKSPVWLYYFDRPVPGVGYGAFHSSALEYFYGNLPCSQVEWEENDQILSEFMGRYLKNFICQGDPNGKYLEKWLPVSQAPDQVMELGTHVGMVPKPHMEAMKVLTRAFGLDQAVGHMMGGKG